jgi:hypothetical protein
VRLLLVLGALLGALLPLPAAQAAGHAQVVVVGVPGLRWDDVTPARTPTLARLARDGAVGALSVKAAGPLTCADDGWLTLGAGNRVSSDGVSSDGGSGDPAASAACTGLLPTAGALDQIAADARSSREGAQVGALAVALRAAGTCVSAVGAGAALAVGQPDPTAPSAPDPTAPSAPCPVRLVDAGSVQDAEAVVSAEHAALQPGATLLVVGLSEPPGAAAPQLHVALARGPAFPPGALVSASTRSAPYVQLVDVAPTVLSLLDIAAPADMTGQPWRSQGAAPTLAELRDLAAKAAAMRQATVPFFVVLSAALLALLAVARWRRSWRLAQVAGLGGTVALGVSYLANLVPWWRAESPLLALLAVVLAGSAVVVAAALAALRGSATGPAGVACGFVAAVLLADLVSGATLQMSSVAGYSPLVAGRFAGIGNVAFGVLAASVLLATAAATQGRSRRTTGLVVGLTGAVAVVVDGAPPWGSDVGGVLALVPAFVLLAMLRTGVRVSLLRLAAAGLAGAAIVTVFALADFSRAPEQRTHLGRFVQDVVEGTAGSLLLRKAQAVLALLFTSPVTALLPVVVAAAVYLVVRPPPPLRAAFAQAPAWRHGLLAVGLASAVGFAVNDSGAAVPALAVLVAVPATVAIVARVSARGEAGNG